MSDTKEEHSSIHDLAEVCQETEEIAKKLHEHLRQDRRDSSAKMRALRVNLLGEVIPVEEMEPPKSSGT